MILTYILLFVVFVAIVEFVDEIADILWMKLLEKFDALREKVDQYFSKRSENSDYDLIQEWPVEYDPDPDPGEKQKFLDYYNSVCSENKGDKT